MEREGGWGEKDSLKTLHGNAKPLPNYEFDIRRVPNTNKMDSFGLDQKV